VKTITLEQIREILPSLDLIPSIEAAFVAYSQRRAVVPPVGELLLDTGEVHIKYGYIGGEVYYVIKIASGFYENPARGLPSGNGLMLLFRQETGELVSVILDEGVLTDTRTAVAGAIAAKYLAPRRVERIGMVGTGVQARMQLLHLSGVVDCRRVLAWGRGKPQLSAYRSDMEAKGFEVETTLDTSDLLRSCNLVVTTTPSANPLLGASELRPGTHITAVGSDTPYKQELSPEILERADVVVADSIAQCMERGEIFKAVEAGRIGHGDLVELGDVISGAAGGRTSDDQITVADLTGVAVQDIKIAEAVYEAAE
jgi:ornithine cyclodeaminase